MITMIMMIHLIICVIANYPLEVIKKLPTDIETGVYFGWANIDNGEVYKAVLSIGWNPFFKNQTKSMVIYFIWKV